jgi:hypothetical protein
LKKNFNKYFYKKNNNNINNNNNKASDLCASVSCFNGGRCNVVVRDGKPVGECWCLSGFSGFYCEQTTGKKKIVSK